jgi:hypothetical protein
MEASFPLSRNGVRHKLVRCTFFFLKCNFEGNVMATILCKNDKMTLPYFGVLGRSRGRITCGRLTIKDHAYRNDDHKTLHGFNQVFWSVREHVTSEYRNNGEQRGSQARLTCLSPTRSMTTSPTASPCTCATWTSRHSSTLHCTEPT